MIPADLAARLRMITEASFFNTDPPVAGLQRAREIQAQLPELVPGERFMATLQRTLPDGTFRAIVAGRQVTLALNTTAKPGDTLELVVTETSPKAVFARLAAPEATAASTSSAQPALSQTGRLISFLLTGQPEVRPSMLANNQPLLAAPPTSAAQLAPMLRQALGQSGMFYEAHQAQWISGKLDLTALLREPQASASPAAAGTPGAAAASPPPSAASANAAAQLGAAANDAVLAEAAGDEATALRTTPVAERLLPVVHQQLDALATNQYVWQGQAWAGQPIEWIIEDPRGGRDNGGDEPPQEWNTTLRLSLPRLGGVEAQLHLTPAGVALRLRSDDAGSRAALESGRATLEESLAAAGLPLTGMVVEPNNGG
ncbi:flagellar hook-length control protein FliK [Azoarcus olearius]|uniref:Flagellar hook-length control protein-like C-terminal domain-containing protein n=1 Tax=Azoarcus sp. (strain BH72) TaxID=418699 RepID=A1K920_AZOSB|nr:flagellar hook-length control protein FliK [Azoarcus olearius]CAL95325.1 hypothetical protein azo2709 [Azoarcus olearius]